MSIRAISWIGVVYVFYHDLQMEWQFTCTANMKSSNHSSYLTSLDTVMKQGKKCTFPTLNKGA